MQKQWLPHGSFFGPNVKRLWSIKMAKDAIPDGGGFEDGLKFFSSKESIAAGAKAASEWCKLVIESVRRATLPNPWKDATDEEIAGELLRRIDAKRACERK